MEDQEPDRRPRTEKTMNEKAVRNSIVESTTSLIISRVSAQTNRISDEIADNPVTCLVSATHWKGANLSVN